MGQALQKQVQDEAAEKANGKNDPATGIKFVSPLNESTFFNVGENNTLTIIVPRFTKMCDMVFFA